MKPQEMMLQRMDQYLVGWQQTDDQRHVFLSCYRMMTASMLQALEGEYFNDKQWVNTLLHQFAEYYFEALTCYDCGNEVPLVWQNVHEFTRNNKLHKLQCLMIGVNAHINYDLVLTLYDMLQPEWPTLSAEQKQIRYEDHCKVNTVISNTIDQVQDEILEPGNRILARIDVAFGRLDEYLISRLIRSWRQDVWEDAQRMLITGDVSEREVLRQTIEARVMKRARLVAYGQQG